MEPNPPGPIPQPVAAGHSSAAVIAPPHPMHPHEPSFLQGWKFFAALGAMITIPITVTVWLVSYHEKHPHDGVVEFREYKEDRDELKEDIRAIKDGQLDTALEMAKQARAIIEFVNIQEKKKTRR